VRPQRLSTFAGKAEDAILQEQFNRGERKGCEVQFLHVDGVVVAVLAGEARSVGGLDCQPPHLKLFSFHSAVAVLCSCDGIDEPVGARLLSQELNSVRVEKFAKETVAVVVLRTGELSEVCLSVIGIAISFRGKPVNR
jgi:hypothetical protein